LPSLLRDTLAPGTLLRADTYCIEYALGRGSFGITYQARHTVLNEVFAIKEYYPTEFVLRHPTDQSVLIPLDKQNAFQRGRYRFIEEARLLAKLNHPNLVKVYDMFEDRATAYMVMNLIQGKTLTRILKAHPGHRLPLPRVESIVAQMVEALEVLHQNGVCHLDLKPENVLLTPDNKICLIDFGAARQLVNARCLETRLFTESYAAPELMSGGEIGPESDLFELGMVAHQLITGKLPPPAMKRLLEQEPWQPEGLVHPWKMLLTEALHLRREQRPQAVRQWWEAGQQSPPGLKHHLGGEGADYLRGDFTHPDLARDRLQHRLGRGVIRSVQALAPGRVVALSAGGAALFDLRANKVLWEIDSPIHQGLLSLDTRLLIVTYQRWISVWDMATGKLIQQFQGHPQAIDYLACSQDQQLICGHHNSDLILTWDARTGEQIRSLVKPPGVITALVVTDDGRYLALGHPDGHISLWDCTLNQEICCLQGHQQPIEALAVSPKGTILASGSRDNTIQLWSIPSGRPLDRLKGHIDWVRTLAFSPNGSLLASSAGINDQSIRLWQVANGKELQRLRGHHNRIHTLSFSRDNQALISGSFDGTLRWWDLAAGSEIQRVRHHSNWIYGLAYSPDSQLLASASNDPTIVIWHRSSARRVNTLTGHHDAVTSVAFSPDSRFLLSGSWDKTLRLWDVTVGNVVRTFPGHRDWINTVAISPDYQYIASAGWENQVRLWELSERWPLLRGHRPQRILAGHLDHVTAVAFSHNSHLLVSASKDQTLRLWEVASGQELHHLIGHKHHVRCVAFSPDDLFIASGSWDKSVRLWHTLSGKQLKPSFRHPDYIETLAYSGDGHYLAAGSRDGTIHLWDLLTGKEARRIRAHTNTINCLTFDRNILMAGDQDGVIRCWVV
jgi:WD40 repeat protein/predicted Ser/Thr protein kinase